MQSSKIRQNFINPLVLKKNIEDKLVTFDSILKVRRIEVQQRKKRVEFQDIVCCDDGSNYKIYWSGLEDSTKYGSESQSNQMVVAPYILFLRERFRNYRNSQGSVLYQ